MKRKHIKDQEGKFYPITSSDAVLCPSGNTLTEELDNVGDAKSVSSNDIHINIDTKDLIEIMYMSVMAEYLNTVYPDINDINKDDFFDFDDILMIARGFIPFNIDKLNITKHDVENFIKNKGLLFLDAGIGYISDVSNSENNFFNTAPQEDIEKVNQIVKERFGITSITDDNYTDGKKHQIEVYQELVLYFYDNIKNDDVVDYLNNYIFCKSQIGSYENIEKIIYLDVPAVKSKLESDLFSEGAKILFNEVVKEFSDNIKYVYVDNRSGNVIHMAAFSEDKIYIFLS